MGGAYVVGSIGWVVTTEFGAVAVVLSLLVGTFQDSGRWVFWVSAARFVVYVVSVITFGSLRCVLL